MRVSTLAPSYGHHNADGAAASNRPEAEAEYAAYARLKLTRDNRQGMIQKGLADTTRELAE